MKKEASFWKQGESKYIICELCEHKCKIPCSGFGKCGVRQNCNGVLYTHAYGEVVAENIDPIEKKPLYHFLPGTLTYSIATIGCNFKCQFCQNWSISQITYKNNTGHFKKITPQNVVKNAINNGCKSISYTYTEPTIFFEYAFDTASIARENGLKNIFVTNGHMTNKVIEAMSKVIDAVNIDLKFFSDSKYKDICDGGLEPVKRNIRLLKEKNVWVEVTTLLISGENDSIEEINSMGNFLCDIDKDIPWHISSFHPDYKYDKIKKTHVLSIEKAIDIGKKCGLNYVYPGNICSQVNTVCPECGNNVITRNNTDGVVFKKMIKDQCECMKKIEGVWN